MDSDIGGCTAGICFGCVSCICNKGERKKKVRTDMVGATEARDTFISVFEDMFVTTLRSLVRSSGD